MIINNFILSTYFYNCLGIRETTQEIVPTSSQEFSTLLPRCDFCVINT